MQTAQLGLTMFNFFCILDATNLNKMFWIFGYNFQKSSQLPLQSLVFTEISHN